MLIGWAGGKNKHLIFKERWGEWKREKEQERERERTWSGERINREMRLKPFAVLVTVTNESELGCLFLSHHHTHSELPFSWGQVTVPMTLSRTPSLLHETVSEWTSPGPPSSQISTTYPHILLLQTSFAIAYYFSWPILYFGFYLFDRH